MTEQQRKGIEILNDLKTDRHDDGTPVISDDDYFFLLSFIIDRPQCQVLREARGAIGQMSREDGSAEHGDMKEVFEYDRENDAVVCRDGILRKGMITFVGR